LLATSSGHPIQRTPADGPAAIVTAPADSYQTVVVNRVVLEIAAPASLVWSYLPGIRVRPGVERKEQKAEIEGFGARYDLIYRDDKGAVTRHDRIQVIHWEPGVRFVALVRYLPPAPPLEIVYNVDLAETKGVTHFVMDSYSTVKLPAGPDPFDQVERESKQRAVGQAAVEKGYQALKAEIEAAARGR
jgi:hypothetical protein